MNCRFECILSSDFFRGIVRSLHSDISQPGGLKNKSRNESGAVGILVASFGGQV